ncbi:Mothers against decapentaplegic homolog 3 [Strongyloides ratti]|uniref:Mothers against decapentaplegic homolog 3 n=1 Tax=Strongyloides ratti TaxID=34506 RepID=A0A090LAS1_STRRB|nr:Mothers against decapentaplegic homolog 3 [Strongyloides ratti]CEF64630.1 Mothers against decapentaplegic homolog 3 [Strongyloides ratti]
MNNLNDNNEIQNVSQCYQQQEEQISQPMIQNYNNYSQIYTYPQQYTYVQSYVGPSVQQQNDILFHSSYPIPNQVIYNTNDNTIDDEYINSIFPQNKTVVPSCDDIEKNMYVRAVNRSELPYYEDNAWCHLKYWEFHSRTGATFRGRSDTIIVDGFCNKDGAKNRFSLGSLTSPERNVAISKVLCQIGSGCHIIKIGDNIKIQSKCKSPIFIQCPMQGAISGTDPACVYRLSPGSEICIYDNEIFSTMLRRAEGIMGLVNLQQYYQTRISFIKGWGENYRRKSITDSPCWLEILIIKPMLMIDSIMMEIDNPVNDRNVDSD